MTRGSPNSTGFVSGTQISTIFPSRGARIGFITFIASIMSNVSPFFTISPALTKEGFPGSGDKYTVPTMGDGTVSPEGTSAITGAIASLWGAGAADTGGET